MTGAIVCFGEMLLRLATRPGERLAEAGALSVVVGGAEANVAVALAALDHKARMVTVLPEGPLGDRARDALAGAGVDTRGIVRASGRMGLYFLESGASLRPAAITYDRAGSAFALADPATFDFAALLGGARLLHLSGITAALGPNGLALSRAAVAAAQAAGVPVSFDPNYRESLWRAWDSDPRAALTELVGGADLLFASHRDIGLLLGQDLPGDTPVGRGAAATAALTAFPNLAAIACTSRQTIGPDHHRLTARVDSRTGQHETQVLDIPDIVDRIGTGDAFAAGVIHAWLDNGDPQAMAETGLKLAALKHGLSGDFCRVGRAELAAFTGLAGDVRR